MKIAWGFREEKKLGKSDIPVKSRDSQQQDWKKDMQEGRGGA